METYTLGYKFRIYPDKEQTELINRTLGCCRFVYNHFLAVRRDQWQTNHKSIGYLETARLLTDLKKREETSWLKEVDSMALQESLRNLDRAFQNFFKLHTGYPHFKSKHSHSQSYRTRNQSNGVRIVGNKIKLPKIGFGRQGSLCHSEPRRVREILCLALRGAGQGKARAPEQRRADWH